MKRGFKKKTSARKKYKLLNKKQKSLNSKKKILVFLLVLIVLGFSFIIIKTLTGFIAFPPGPSVPSNPGDIQTCDDNCTSGSKECFEGGYRACEDYNKDGCLEWGATTDCKLNEECSEGFCVKAKSDCNGEACSLLNSTRENNGTTNSELTSSEKETSSTNSEVSNTKEDLFGYVKDNLSTKKSLLIFFKEKLVYIVISLGLLCFIVLGGVFIKKIRKKKVTKLEQEHPAILLIYDLLEKGNSYLDSGEKEKAREIYKEIERIYTPLKSTEPELHQKIIDFYERFDNL